MATLKQPLHRGLTERIMSRIGEFQLPKIDLNLISELSTVLKLSQLGSITSVGFIPEWASALKMPSVNLDMTVISELAKIRLTRDRAKQKKLSAPVQGMRSTTRCINSEMIIAIEAILFGLLPLAMELEEVSGPVVLLELAFFTLCTLATKMKLNVPYEQFTGSREWDRLWNDVLSTVEDPREWIASYFVGAQFEDLSREDVFEFITWAMFTTTPEYIDVEDRVEVDRSVALIEDFIGYRFPPKKDEVKKFNILRPSIEPLRAVHKPLLFYAVTQGVFGALLSHRMSKHNFVRKTEGELIYWTNVDSVHSDKAPIVMAHGIGGLCAYFDFIRSLLPLDAPLIVLEIPSVSLHIAPNVPSIEAHVQSMSGILDKHGFEKAVFIGHSFGSSIVSWMVQSRPERVAASVFMDPVVFMLHLTDILKNWTYEEPVNQLSLEGLLDIVKTGEFVHDTLLHTF